MVSDLHDIARSTLNVFAHVCAFAHVCVFARVCAVVLWTADRS